MKKALSVIMIMLLCMALLCSCGKKASVNARIDESGHIVTEGSQVMLGGNDSYIAMCHRCYKKGIGR